MRFLTRFPRLFSAVVALSSLSALLVAAGAGRKFR